MIGSWPTKVTLPPPSFGVLPMLCMKSVKATSIEKSPALEGSHADTPNLSLKSLARYSELSYFRADCH